MTDNILKSTPRNFLFGELEPKREFYVNGPSAPFAWYGGKYYYARWIIEHFPEHRVYIEPFGGAGNILLNKDHSDVEIFNDIDGRLVNFFRVLRDREPFEELNRQLRLTPYSREIFEECLLEGPTEDKVREAYKFFVLCRQAIGGTGTSKLTKRHWTMSLRARRKMAEPVSKYLSAIDGLEEVAERFATVAVEHMDAIELIEKYDRDDALIYCDPPYLPQTRYKGITNHYANEMSFEDHEKFLDVLLACKGKVVLSGYHSELYDQKLSGWKIDTLTTKAHMKNSGQTREEVLWMNWGN